MQVVAPPLSPEWSALICPCERLTVSLSSSHVPSIPADTLHTVVGHTPRFSAPGNGLLAFTEKLDRRQK